MTDLQETIRARVVDWASSYNRLDSVRLREAKVLIDDCLTLLKAQQDELELFRDIAANSDGVSGWHLNGDVADWEEFDLAPPQEQQP